MFFRLSDAWQGAKAIVFPVSPAIPYRTGAQVSSGTFAFALLATILLLAVMIGVLFIARRRGWISSTPRSRTQAPGEGIELLSSRRLSVATVVHVVAYRGQSYLIVESGRGSTARVLLSTEPEQGREAGP